MVPRGPRIEGGRLRPPSGGQLPAELKAAFQEVGQHRWWRLSLVTALPAYWAAWLIPALHGWPRNTIEGIWLLALMALYVDLAISYRRQRKTARDHAQ
jgi:hypothetical protein